MPIEDTTAYLAMTAALSLCVEELDNRFPDWREGLTEKVQFAARDGAARFGDVERVNDAGEMERIANLIRRTINRA